MGDENPGYQTTSDLFQKIDFGFHGLLTSLSAYGQILDRASRSVKKLSERIALVVTCRFLTVLAQCVGVPVSPFPLSKKSIHEKDQCLAPSKD